jgi:hypothetical protein
MDLDYVGANAGYAWSRDGGALECINPKGVSFGGGCGLIPFGGLNASGGFGGGQVGYDRQFGKYVLGVETDFQGADIRGSTSTSGPWLFVGNPALSPPGSLFTPHKKSIGSAPHAGASDMRASKAWIGR